MAVVPPGHTSVFVKHEHGIHLYGETKNVELRGAEYWNRFWDGGGNWRGRNWLIIRCGGYNGHPNNLIFRRNIIRVVRVRGTGRWFEWGSGDGRVRYWAPGGSTAIWLGPVDPTWGSAL